jgi:hypothetical protein
MRLRGWLSPGRLLASLAVANLLLGVGLFALRSPLRQDTNAPPAELPAQLQDLQARMDGRHRGEPFSLTLTNAELTAAVAVFLQESSGVPFSDVRVAVARDQVVVDGTARGAAFAVPVRATLTATVVEGHPVVRVVKVSLGRTTLPAFVRDQILAQANASLDLSQYDLGVTLDALTLGSGTLTVRGTIN